MVLKFHMQHDQTLGLQNDKILLGQESKLAANGKNSKTYNINFFPEWHGIFGWYFVWSINGTVLLRIINWKKIGCRIRSQWPTSCLRVQFCQNANISITKNSEKCITDFILWTTKWILTKSVSNWCFHSALNVKAQCRCDIALRRILVLMIKQQAGASHLTTFDVVKTKSHIWHRWGSACKWKLRYFLPFNS